MWLNIFTLTRKFEGLYLHCSFAAVYEFIDWTIGGTGFILLFTKTQNYLE